MKNVKQAAEILKSSGSLLVITGAGVSAESGIPTYRGPGGLYTKNPDLENTLILENLKNNSIKIWEYINTLRIFVAKSVPNKAHLVLAKWEKEGLFDKFLIATQNVDGLHGFAGNNSFTELHGNIWEFARLKEVDYAEDERFSEEMQAYIDQEKLNFDVISIPGMLRIFLYESISTAPLISLWSVMATPMPSFSACLAISSIELFPSE